MKNNDFMRKQLLSMLSVFGILLITVMFTGIAWSRFREEDVKVMHIETYHQRRFYMFGRLEDETDITAEKIVTEAGTLPGVIEQDNNEKRIRFYVTNGPEKDKFNSTDLTYSIHVLVTNTLKPEELDFVLRYTDTDGEQKAINATPVRISEDDPLYRSIGDGYIYKFMAEKQVQVVDTSTGAESGDTATVLEEYRATLEKGQLNYHAYDLQIVGQPEAGLLEIEIIEVETN